MSTPTLAVPFGEDSDAFPSSANNTSPVLPPHSFENVKPKYFALLNCESPEEAKEFLDKQAAAYAAGRKKEIDETVRTRHILCENIVTEMNYLNGALKNANQSFLREVVTYRWPKEFLKGCGAVFLFFAGLACLGIGWSNSARVVCEYLQSTWQSYGFTAPLLLLPLATHVSTSSWGLSERALHILFGLTGAIGGGLLLYTLTVTPSSTDSDAFNWLSVIPQELNQGRLLVAQTLLECSLGTILLHHFERLLFVSSERTINPEREQLQQQQRVCENRLIKVRDEIAALEAEREKLNDSREHWINTFLLQWKELRKGGIA